jgi:U3 small nucleolar RNA-associated protein 13
MNYVAVKDYRNAISLALAMDHPGRLLSLFKQILRLDGKATTMPIHSQMGVDDVLQSLPPVELVALLRHARDWNANAKSSVIAQGILNSLLKLRSIDDFSNAFSSSEYLATLQGVKMVDNTLSFNELVQTLIPYTERHLARLDRLVQDSYVLDYVLGEMDGGLATNGEEMEIDG